MQYVAALTRPASAGGGAGSDGMTICATIHSPTAATFALFSRVMVLLRGRVVFFGKNGGLAQAAAAELGRACCQVAGPAVVRRVA